MRSRRDIAAGAGRRGDGGPPPRRSTGALHDCLAARGAVFGEVHGYERPRWFARDGVAATDSNGWRRQPWHDAVVAECAAVRDAAGLLDLTAFSKFEVSGRHAVRFLDRISANPPPARVGRVKLAHLLTPAGNFETELTPEIGLVEAGMLRFFRPDGRRFIGREATLARIAAGLSTRMVCLAVDTLDADCHGGECVLFDGRPVGMVSSGGYGHRTSRSYAFAFVEPRLTRPGTALEVVILEEARAATVLDGPAYDPTNLRIRS